MKKTVIFALAVLFVMSTFVMAADVKIAVCDVTKIMKAYPAAQEAEKAIVEQKAEYEAESKEMLAKHKEMKAALITLNKSTENKAISDEEKAKRIREVEKNVVELRNYERKIRETLELRQKQLADYGRRVNKRISSTLKEIIADYAKEQGLSLILAKGGTIDTVLYNSDSIDVTEGVLKEMKKSEKSKK